MTVEPLGDPVSPRHLFGDMLRFYRTKAGLSQEQLGAAINYSHDLISKIETGQRPPTEDFMLACEATPTLNTNGALKELHTRLHQHFKQRAYPSWFANWPDFEARASALRTWENMAVPGLLQTEEYARAIHRTRVRATLDEIEEMVAARIARQAILTRENPPMFWVLMDEAVLRRPVGGIDVMRKQLDKLIAAAELPNVVIEIIPWSVGGHQGMTGSFVIADLPGSSPVAYQEGAVRGQIAEDSETISALMELWDTLKAEALPRSASLELMKEVAQTMEITNWRKASYSGGNGGNCVEVGATKRTVAVRDSKDPHGPALTFAPEAWQAFLAQLKRAGR
jgi:transcriptional regulator with XRE-family HTH domain